MTVSVVKMRRRVDGGRMCPETHEHMGDASDLFDAAGFAIFLSTFEPGATFSAWRPNASAPTYFARAGELYFVDEHLTGEPVLIDHARAWS